MKKREQIRVLKAENADLAAKHKILQAEHERIKVEHADLRLLAWALVGRGAYEGNGKFQGCHNEARSLWCIRWDGPQGLRNKIYIPMAADEFAQDADGLPQLPLPIGLREAIKTAMANAKGERYIGI